MSSGAAGYLVSLILPQRSPVYQGKLHCSAAPYLVPLQVVRQVLPRHLILAGSRVPLRDVTLHMACVSGVLVPCWTFNHKTVSALTDYFERVRVESCAELVSFVLFD